MFKNIFFFAILNRDFFLQSFHVHKMSNNCKLHSLKPSFIYIFFKVYLQISFLQKINAIINATLRIKKKGPMFYK